MGNAILNKLMNLLISLARDVVVPPLVAPLKSGPDSLFLYLYIKDSRWKMFCDT